MSLPISQLGVNRSFNKRYFHALAAFFWPNKSTHVCHHIWVSRFAVCVSLWVASASLASAQVIPLTSGEPATFELPAVEQPTVVPLFQIEVQDGAHSLQVSLQSSATNDQIDLYLRLGAAPVEGEDGGVTADHAGEAVTANEMLMVTAESTPPLAAGTYFIAVRQSTLDRVAQGSVLATMLTEAPMPLPAAGMAAGPMNVIATVAGTDFVFDGDGRPARGARLSEDVYDAEISPDGELHLADLGHRMVMKVRADGILEVVAGNGSGVHSGLGGPARSAGMFPSGIAFSPLGELYIADRDGMIYRIDPAADVQLFFDLASIEESARMRRRIAFDSTGNLYVSESELHRVLRITPQGAVSVYAGTGEIGFSGDGGPATAARLNFPEEIVLDAASNLFIAELDNNIVRRVSSDGMIATVAGNGGFARGPDEGPALGIPLAGPAGVAIGPTGELFLSEIFVNRVRRLTPDGRLVAVVGNGGRTDSIDGPGGNPIDDLGDGGPAIDATFFNAFGLSFDAQGNLYITDRGNRSVRRVDLAGMIDTAAGGGEFRFAGDRGPAVQAVFNEPLGLEFDADGGLLIADNFNDRIRRVDLNGMVDTIIGTGAASFTGDGGPASEASVSPEDMTFDAFGNLYIAAELFVRKVNSAGIISTIARIFGVGLDNDPTTLDGAEFSASSIAISPTGVLFAADTRNHRIRRIDLDGRISTIAGNGVPGFSGDGGPADQAQVAGPRRVAFGRDGALYFSDTLNNRVRRIGADGTVTTIAGIGEPGISGDGGPAIQARFNNPDGLVFDSDGALYVADGFNGRVRRIGPGGLVSTVAGTIASLAIGGDGGPADRATLAVPSDLAIDQIGNLYIADRASHRVRAVLSQAPTFLPLPLTELQLVGSAGGPESQPRPILATTAVPGMAFTTAARTNDGGDWLVVNPASGATPRQVTVKANPGALALGRYVGEVDVIVPLAQPAVRTIAVTLDVGDALPPDLHLNVSSLLFSFAADSGARSEAVTLTNRGGGVIEYSILTVTDNGGEWLKVNASSDQVSPNDPVNLEVTADPEGLPAGSYTGRVVLEGSGNTIGLPVTMTVSDQEVAMLLSQRGLSFLAVEGGGVIPPQTFGVLNTGRGSMSWSVSTRTLAGGDWLSATPTTGVSRAGAEAPLVEVAIDQSALAAGVYYGLVEVFAESAPNSLQQVPVFVEVLAERSDPGAQLTPRQLVFTGVQGSNPSSQEVLVFGVSAESKSFRGAASTDLGRVWFQTLPNDAQVLPDRPTRMVIQPFDPQLLPGVHRGLLPLQFSDGQVETVAVTLVQSAAEGSAPAQAGCVAQTLLPRVRSLGSSFDVSSGWPVALEVQVVDDCGRAIDEGSVTVEFSNGDPQLSLVSLRNGRWDGTWQTGGVSDGVTLKVRAEAPALSGVSEVAGTLGSRIERPEFRREGVVSAADFDPVAPAPPAPGGLISIFGTRLAEGQATAEQLPLPESLASTSVFIGGIPAPLLFSGGGQVNALVPLELTPNTSHRLLIQRGTTLTEAVDISVAVAQPAIFKTTPGASQGHVYRFVDGTQILADELAPAVAGDILIIYAAGLGAVDPTPPSGEAAGFDLLSRSAIGVEVKIQGADADVQFSGLAPGFAGLYQVNAVTPSGLASTSTGDIVIEAGDLVGPAATMALR